MNSINAGMVDGGIIINELEGLLIAAPGPARAVCSIVLGVTANKLTLGQGFFSERVVGNRRLDLFNPSSGRAISCWRSGA